MWTRIITRDPEPAIDALKVLQKLELGRAKKIGDKSRYGN
jgi:hypothetical protein